MAAPFLPIKVLKGCARGDIGHRHRIPYYEHLFCAALYERHAAKLSLWAFCHLASCAISSIARRLALRCAHSAQNSKAAHVRPFIFAAKTGISRCFSSALRAACVRHDCQALDVMVFCRRATAMRTACFAEAAWAAC